MLVAIIQVYNDIDGVKRLHSELSKHGIKSIWGDGRFCDFQKVNDSDLSTDGTREYIQAQNNTVLLDLGDMLEYDKLTSILHHAGSMGYEYALLLSCDEVPKGSFPDLEEYLRTLPDTPAVLRLKFDANEWKTHPDKFVERLFHYPARISCKLTHWCYHIDDHKDVYLSDIKPVEGVSIYHDNTIRPRKRELQMAEYQCKQIKNERGDHLAKRLGISSKVDLKSLKKLYPNHEIRTEKDGYYTVLGKVDIKKLLFTWKIIPTNDGLLVYS